MVNKRFAEVDWVNSTIIGDLSVPPSNRIATKSTPLFTQLDSNEAIRTGLDVIELDTIPAEFCTLFDNT